MHAFIVLANQIESRYNKSSARDVKIMQARTRRAIQDVERKAIFAAWHNICAYCENNPAEAVDHIVPFSKGGECVLENFAACCTRCNLKKKANSFGEGYLQIILAIAAKKAPKISEAIERAKKPKPVKPVKDINKLARDQNYIKTNPVFDWTNRHTEILNQLTPIDEDIYSVTINSCEATEIAYGFNLLVKIGNTRFSTLSGYSGYIDSKYVTMKIRKEGIPYLHICAERMAKAKEIIVI
jgi:hypothetical protein